MLQKPDKCTEKLLKHADFLDGLEPERFSMRVWGVKGEPRCICGWLMYNEGRMDMDNWVDAAEILGIDQKMAEKMFAQPFMENSPKEAAKVLRHYAVTGEFKGW